MLDNLLLEWKSLRHLSQWPGEENKAKRDFYTRGRRMAARAYWMARRHPEAANIIWYLAQEAEREGHRCL